MQRKLWAVQGKERKVKRKVKRAGKSDRTPFIHRPEYYNLHDGLINIFTAIIINRKNWTITIKNLILKISVFFFKKANVHTF